ncbi:MAG: hypothetical protein KF708_17110 [Pirellulales bacterium]|nr:hypothetical protein [Pirellulales bacterium]
MTPVAWIVVGAVAGALVAIALAWRPFRAAMEEARFVRARRDFHQQRERIEARFVDLASSSGRPRGLRWIDCEFENDVAYARDRRTGELSAFVGVTIAFEAIEGGGMEHVEAVGNLRAATAVFRHQRAGWQTDGRVVFNLNPTEAIAYYHDHFEMVGQELAQRV